MCVESLNGTPADERNNQQRTRQRNDRRKTKGTVGTRHRWTGRGRHTHATKHTPMGTCLHFMHTHKHECNAHAHSHRHTAHMQTMHIFMVCVLSHSQGRGRRTGPELNCTFHTLGSFCETTSVRKDINTTWNSTFSSFKSTQPYFRLNWSQHQHVKQEINNARQETNGICSFLLFFAVQVLYTQCPLQVRPFHCRS